jgi:hypothetical protein
MPRPWNSGSKYSLLRCNLAAIRLDRIGQKPRLFLIDRDPFITATRLHVPDQLSGPISPIPEKFSSASLRIPGR